MICNILTASMSFRFSYKTDLSLISADAIQVLIWSRSLCNFLISFLRSSSYFSFWLLLEAWCTFCQVSSNLSTPSATFLRQRSISAKTRYTLIKPNNKNHKILLIIQCSTLKIYKVLMNEKQKTLIVENRG